MSVPASPSTPLDIESSTRLRAVVGRLARQLRATPSAIEAGLTPTRTSLLLTIDRRGPIRLSEVGDIEGLNPTMSRSVTCLVDDALVQRTSDEGDRRAAWVEVTDAGRALADRMRQERTTVINDGLAGLDADQRRVVERAIPALEALAEKLKERGR